MVIGIAAPDFRSGVDQAQSELSSLDLHADQTFETFNLREDELPRSQADNLRRAYDSALAFAERPGDWLVFNSTGYGNGKTHLAAAIANYVEKRANRSCSSLSPIFWIICALRSTRPPMHGWIEGLTRCAKPPCSSLTTWARKVRQSGRVRNCTSCSTTVTTHAWPR